MFDYHIHTHYSDGRDHFDRVLQRAIDLKLDEIGFSDHFTIVPRDPKIFYGRADSMGAEWFEDSFTEGYSMKKSSLDEYFSLIAQKRETMKDYIKVKASVELEYFPENWDSQIALIESYVPDYILGCVHKHPIEGEYGYIHICDPAFYYKLTEDEYLDFCKKDMCLITEMVKTGKCDILAHFNCVKAYRPLKKEEELYDYYRELAQALRDTDTCAELNTYFDSGSLHDPNFFFLKECARLEVPVIMSSDAHWTEQVAQNYNFGLVLLKAAGVKYTARFDKRKKTVEEIKYFWA